MNEKEKLREEIALMSCPVCGFYCLGKGGRGCIDKYEFYTRILLNK